MLMRVQKYLAHQGIASRRSIEKMINERRISINGTVVTEQGVKIDPDKDQVAIDNANIRQRDIMVYYWLNKPAGIISAASNKAGETTVTDLIHSNYRIYPVGRLDKDSSGLILLTNDGELTHRLTHPKFHVDKIYVVTVAGSISESKLNKLRSGIKLEEGITKPAEVIVLKRLDQGARLQFTLHEGKNRQIRRMCAAVHLSVNELVRTNFGSVSLAKLGVGEFRIATKSEIMDLKHQSGLM